MRLNLNDNIKVKLTEHGKDIYYHKYDRTNAFLGRELCKPSYPKVDEDGYTTFQLWCFMELYGVHIGMTLPNVIEPLDIVFDEPTIEPEPQWIPVTERLPEPRTDVWVNSDIGQIQGYYEENVKIWYASFGQGRDYLELIVNAWMPLPEPYQEGGEQE